MVFRSNSLTKNDIAKIFNVKWEMIEKISLMRDTKLEKYLSCMIPRPINKIGRIEYYDEKSLDNFKIIINEIKTDKHINQIFNCILYGSKEQKKLVY